MIKARLAVSCVIVATAAVALTARAGAQPTPNPPATAPAAPAPPAAPPPVGFTAGMCGAPTFGPNGTVPHDPGQAAARSACIALCNATDPSAFTKARIDECMRFSGVHQFMTSVHTGGAGPAAALPWVSIVTDFFVKRLKGELTLFLKDQIATVLCKDGDHGVVLQLIPKTCAVLEDPKNLISTLPTAFRTDLNALPDSLLTLVISLAADELHNDDATKVLCTASILPQPYRDLRDKGPLAALKDLRSATTSRPQCTEVVGQINTVADQVLQLLAEADPQGDAVIPVKTSTGVKSLVVGAAALAVAANLSDPEIQSRVAKVKARLEGVEPMVGELATTLRQLYAGDHSNDVVDRAANLSMQIVAKLMDVDDQTRSDLLFLGQSIADFATHRYSEGMWSLQQVTAIDDFMSKHKTTEKVWNAIGKWGGLLAALAEAKTAEEAQGILEAAAVPLGSYKEFRTGGWKGFISGYGGVAGGGEYVFGTSGASAGTVGPFLAVGFEIGHPLCTSSSFNALISVIDVGALATAQIGADAKGDTGMNNDVRQAPGQSFSSVFAPGLFVGFGLGKTPLVLGLGAELLPQSVQRFACTSGGSCSDTVSAPTLRGMVYLAADLTAFRVF